MEKLTVNVQVKFKAPMAKVWQGLTDPAMVKKYFFGTDLESSWRVGEPIKFSGKWGGKKYEDHGTILDIDPGTFVKYSYWSSMSGTDDKPENYANVTYNLTENNGETELTVTQDNVKNEEAKAHSEQNWKGIFEELRKLIE
ncbi:SRPBCC family protein [Mucilaginibacter gossypii]|uniref:SRPBCC family protein n=1 Tax=Mucilaginibacter gossypii TaxID=551996 RepID=UPI000DCBBC3F|nr:MULTISPECIES: SRPBCC family protein [Mucilaginibacter]QTE37779.1 SRPBCC family protein [Mucilaginibacter gossypii]RAV60575.1 SRPBCC domain-containing protein [Mucilaginibacter rubeus]